MKYTTYNRKMNGASQLCLIVAMLLATQSFSQNKIIIHATGVANSGVDSIWRTAGIDSIFYSIGANTYKIKDSAVGADTNFAINDLTLTGDRTHTFGGYKMTFTGSHTYAANQGMFKVLNSGTGVAIYASNTSAAGATIYGQGGAYGVQGQVTSGRGVYGFATTGIGVVGYSSSSGTGVYAQSSTGTPLLATSNGTGINTVNTGIYVLKQHNSPGTVDDGIGVSI